QIDPRIRVPGGITIDGGGGTDTLIIPATAGQAFLQKPTAGADRGTIQIANPFDLTDSGVQLNFMGISQIQANLPPAQAVLPAGDVNSQLAPVKAGLTFLTSAGALNDALLAGLDALPLVGTAINDLLSSLDPTPSAPEDSGIDSGAATNGEEDE